MTQGDYVVREIALVGLAETYRSAVRMVRQRRTFRRKRMPVAQAALRRANGSLVVITSRDGRLHIGRMWLATGHVELWQIIQGIPCRQRFAFKDVVSCYVYSSSNEWDETTQPGMDSRDDPTAAPQPVSSLATQTQQMRVPRPAARP